MTTEQMHPTVAERIEEAQRTGATILDLSELGLTALPDAIGRLSSLQGLYLDDNQLSELPDAIGQLSSLQSLDLNDNQLNELPDTIGQLSSLQSLYLRYTLIANLYRNWRGLIERHRCA
ncbi:MAG: leucine-rich repeat domain-containing protein [Chloroflexota bacterium]